MNNFLARKAGQRCVVFLDEFEKTTADVHKSLLLPFDNGKIYYGRVCVPIIKKFFQAITKTDGILQMLIAPKHSGSLPPMH